MANTKKVDWALAPAPESKDHVNISQQCELFPGGKWQKPKSGTHSALPRNLFFGTINPANEQNG